jgi:hypothetical protein
MHTCIYLNIREWSKFGIRICFFWLHWKNFSWQHCILFFRLFILRSARVSALMIVLSDSPCEIIGNWKPCPILKEDIFGMRLAGTSVTKTGTLLSVSRATVSEVMSTYTDHEKKTWAKRKSGLKSAEIVVYWEGLYRKITKLLQHRWQDSETEYSSWRPRFHKKLSRRELHKSNIHGRAAIAEHLITEINA